MLLKNDKKILFILAYTCYVFFVLGLFLHTSAHPQIFHKYTVKYALLLAGILLLFPVFLWLMWFILHDTRITFRKRKIFIMPIHKFIILLL